MKGTVIALSQIRDHLAAALVQDGQLTDLHVDGDAPPIGTIYRAICDRPVKGTGGIFLNLPDGQRAYMRQAKGLKPGQKLVVQLTGYAEPGKARPVTPRLIFKSRYAIVTPDAPGLNISRRIRDDEERLRLHDIATEAGLPPELGLILRSQAVGAEDDEIAEDIAAMAEAARAVMSDPGDQAECLLEGPDAHQRAWIDWPAPDLIERGEDAFAHHGLPEALDALRQPEIRLGEASAYIEPTRALVAVDVNTRGDFSPAAGLKANIALARALPRELRCRGLGGQITLDLAPMPKKDRRQWEQALRAAFRDDPVETALAGWTPLGHFELQRKRERAPTGDLI